MVAHFLVVLLLTLLVAVPSSSQEPTPDPHSLAYCTNHGGHPAFPMQEPHICGAMCDRNCGDEGHQEKRACLTFCRPDHCHCLFECR